MRARDLAVELAHAVVVVGGADREHGHRERRRPVARVDAAEREELRLGDAERGAVRLEVAAHEARVERVVARGHGRVRREDVAGAVAPRRRRRTDAPRSRMTRPMRSTARNAEWPSFMWQTVGERPTASSAWMPADAEHDLLADAELLVAAVEGPGDGPVARRVLLEVRVEQKQRHAADLHLPELREDDAVRVLHVG